MTEKKSNPAPIGKPAPVASSREETALIDNEQLQEVIPEKDRIEGLAKRLCIASGYRPDAYFMGKERWTQFTEDAMRFLVAFEFLKELDNVR